MLCPELQGCAFHELPASAPQAPYRRFGTESKNRQIFGFALEMTLAPLEIAYMQKEKALKGTQANIDEWTKWANMRLKVFEERVSN